MIKLNPPNAQKDYFNTDHLKSGLRTRALKGASLTVIGQGTSFVIETAGTITLARLLTPHDFGLVTMVASLSLLLQSFGVNGFVEAVVQRREIGHSQISTLFWINVSLSFFLMLLFTAFGPLIVWFYKEPLLKPIVGAMALSIFLGGLSNQHVSLLTRNMEFSKTISNELVARVVSITAAILLAWKGFGYWALVAKWVTIPLMITLGSWLLCRWRPGLPARGTGVRPLLKFALHTYGNFVMSYFRRNIDKILIGRSFGSQQLGYYDRAYHLSNMLPVQILSPLNSVAIATFSRLIDDPERFRHNYLKVLSILAFIGMPLSAALTLTSHDVILLILGPHWSRTGKIFLAFGPSIGVAIIYLTHGWLHLSLGTPDRWFRWSIVEFIVTILCITIGLQFGALGVAVAFSISFYLLLGPALWYAGKPIGLKLSPVISTLWKYYISGFISALLCWLVFYKYAPVSDLYNDLNVLARIVIACVLCIALYLVLIIAFHKSTKPVTNFVSVLREMVGKKL